MKEGFIKNRLREASTWRGIVGLLTLIGIALTPEQQELVAGLGVTVYALLETFMPDAPAEEKEKLKRAKELPNRVKEDSSVDFVGGE